MPLVQTEQPEEQEEPEEPELEAETRVIRQDALEQQEDVAPLPAAPARPFVAVSSEPIVWAEKKAAPVSKPEKKRRSAAGAVVGIVAAVAVIGVAAVLYFIFGNTGKFQITINPGDDLEVVMDGSRTIPATPMTRDWESVIGLRMTRLPGSRSSTNSRTVSSSTALACMSLNGAQASVIARTSSEADASFMASVSGA